MADSNLIIDLKIELSIPEKEGGKYSISVGGANLYKVENDKLIPLDVTVSGKLRGAGGGGDKPRGAGGIGDKPRGAGGIGDKPRGAGGVGDKPRGAGGIGDKPRGASGAGDKPKGTPKAAAKTKKAK